MSKQFVSDLVVNTRVASPFIVRTKALVPFKGKPGRFLSLDLSDRTGQIKGVVWDNAEKIAEGFAEGQVVHVKGQVSAYQGQPQIVIAEVSRAEEGSYELTDLVPRAGRSEEELLTWLDATVAEVQQPHLRALLQAFFGDPDFRLRMARAHGARALHHAYVGGLLEHTLSVATILKTVADLHPELSRDLLLCGALLHDIGKLEELKGDIAADYTDVGRFVGHTVLTDRMVTARIAAIEGFDPNLANLLAHMLLSHHGEKEWGAPVEPRTMEACALHYADNLDARVQGFKQVVEAGGPPDSNWSAYHRSYQTEIWIGPRPRTPEPDADAPPTARTAS